MVAVAASFMKRYMYIKIKRLCNCVARKKSSYNFNNEITTNLRSMTRVQFILS